MPAAHRLSHEVRFRTKKNLYFKAFAAKFAAAATRALLADDSKGVPGLV